MNDLGCTERIDAPNFNDLRSAVGGAQLEEDQRAKRRVLCAAAVDTAARWRTVHLSGSTYQGIAFVRLCFFQTLMLVRASLIDQIPLARPAASGCTSDTSHCT